MPEIAATPEVPVMPEIAVTPEVPVIPEIAVASEVPVIPEIPEVSVASAPIVQDVIQPTTSQDLAIVELKDRLLSKEEKELFGKIAPIKDLQIKIARAIDLMALKMGTGNVLVMGEVGIDRIAVAKSMMKCLQLKNPNFTGKVAKIRGDLFSTKDVAVTLAELENGALIIEDANTLEPDILANLLYYLDRLQIKGILVILEGTKDELDRLMYTYPQMDRIFSSKVEIEVLDNDGLVDFAKFYANSLEYSIDEMGVLAIYTRISDMQTNEHAVTIKEVKCMVNDAIDHAEKKNVKHFVDVLFGKRFNDDDMIILRESDFSIE